MYETHELFFLWTETPLHAGSGSNTGAIDLPIQRDRQTGHPIVQSGGVKGVMREHCDTIWQAQSPNPHLTDAIFGPESGDLYAGAISFSEARLLLFPVRSLCGVVAWITCPMALARFRRDLGWAIGTDFPTHFTTNAPGIGLAFTTASTPIHVQAPAGGGSTEIVLEEFCFTVVPTQATNVVALAAWLSEMALPDLQAYGYWKQRLHASNGASHLVVLSDDDFRDFATRATNVETRIRIDGDTGTVATGALWTEECLPADSLLYTVMHAMAPRGGSAVPNALKELRQIPDSSGTVKETLVPSAEKVRAAVEKVFRGNDLILLGGGETIGRGFTRVIPRSPVDLKPVSPSPEPTPSSSAPSTTALAGGTDAGR